MKHLYVLLFIIAMQKSSLIASWQVSVGVELHDTQLQNVSVGVQTSNALTKKLYADTEDKDLFSQHANRYLW